jgi:hypothetical protein
MATTVGELIAKLQRLVDEDKNGPIALVIEDDSGNQMVATGDIGVEWQPDTGEVLLTGDDDN